jgi:hypothetical protein
MVYKLNDNIFFRELVGLILHQHSLLIAQMKIWISEIFLVSKKISN